MRCNALLADQADLLLRGHLHAPLAEAWSDPDRHLAQLASGCLYEGDRADHWPNGCHVLEIDLDASGRPQRYSVWFRSWSPRGHWYSDSSPYGHMRDGRLVAWRTVSTEEPTVAFADTHVETASAPSPRTRWIRARFTGPALPHDFVTRQQETEDLIRRLLESHNLPHTIVLQGAGGRGKTTLAAAVCHDKRVQETFSDGILWLTIGQHADLAALLRYVIRLLGGSVPSSDRAVLATVLSRLLTGRRVLLVLDDVWRASTAEPFIAAARSCLITTRVRALSLGVKAQPFLVDAMALGEATALLVGGAVAEAKPFEALAERLGRWPLPLRLVGPCPAQVASP